MGLGIPVVTQATICKIGFSCSCSAKPGCRSCHCLHWALQDGLLWCDQINQKSLGSPALPQSFISPWGASCPLRPAPLSLTRSRGFPALPPEGRFHNRLKFKVREGFLVCCHAGFCFAQKQPPLSKHPLAPWTFYFSIVVMQPSAPPPTVAKPLRLSTSTFFLLFPNSVQFVSPLELMSCPEIQGWYFQSCRGWDFQSYPLLWKCLISPFSFFFFFLLLALESPRELWKPQPVDSGDRDVGEASAQPMWGRGCCGSGLCSALQLVVPCWGMWEKSLQGCTQIPALLGVKAREKRALARLHHMPSSHQPFPLSRCTYDTFWGYLLVVRRDRKHKNPLKTKS